MYKESLKVDQLGRITIPIGVRRNLGIIEGKRVDVRYDNEKLEVLKASSKDINGSIEDIERAAKENKGVTANEYKQLKEILNKLK